MADLLDIAPSTTTTTVAGISGDHTLDVRGLSGNAIASIVSRFPDLGFLLTGNVTNMAAKIIEQFGESIGPMIAAGCGHLNDKQYEQRAGDLSVEDQLKILNAIIRLTFPNGLAPFIQQVATLLTGEEGPGEKTYKVRLRKSQETSPPLSGEASLPTMQ